MDIIEGLQNLGLNQKEAKVYTSLLQAGETTAYAIAETSGLKRPTVYVILDELRRKGLVLKIPHAKKQLFSAKSPHEFLGEAQDKLDRAKGILPQLLALTKAEKKPKTYLFEGVKGYEEALQIGTEEMCGKEMLNFFSYSGSNASLVSGVLDKYFKNTHKLGITFRGILPEHETVVGVEKKYPNLKVRRVSPEVYSTDNAITISDRHVKIFSNDLQTVVIENKSIAQTFRQIFEMAWATTTENGI